MTNTQVKAVVGALRDLTRVTHEQALDSFADDSGRFVEDFAGRRELETALMLLASLDPLIAT